MYNLQDAPKPTFLIAQNSYLSLAKHVKVEAG